MNLIQAVNHIKYQLQEIDTKEKINQEEQAATASNIQRLEAELKNLKSELQQQYQRQSELDQEAIELCSQSEDLNNTLKKLEKIAALSEEYKTLQLEFKDNQDLLETLYSSIATISAEDINSEHHFEGLNTQNQDSEDNEEVEQYNLDIDHIKSALPNAEKLYQKLVAGYLEEYHTYQNLIVDGLDLIWCSVAFIAFGRSSYRQMSRKYHPDLEGSQRAMQLINTAWEIAQEYSQENS
ncbi:MAG: molecular chaperone DnaJ [Xenococcaceae cyanobacterium MO_207.B15]|nr:molecular chaperone DnaJ [Xenococcaceae cyanobacterium MO_207.B15]